MIVLDKLVAGVLTALGAALVTSIIFAIRILYAMRKENRTLMKSVTSMACMTSGMLSAMRSMSATDKAIIDLIIAQKINGNAHDAKEQATKTDDHLAELSESAMTSALTPEKA